MTLSDLTPEQRKQAAHLAIGRLLRLMSRPTQPGDVAEYERLRAVVLAAAEEPS